MFIKLIGIGSSSDVYKYRIGDEDYAAKQVYTLNMDEINIMMKLRSIPEILHLHTVINNLLILELMDLTLVELSEIIKQEDKTQKCNQVITDICVALKHVHDKNIIHRDVKPGNIFYSFSKDKFKLGDFGSAREYSSGMTFRAATLVYTPPEYFLEDSLKDVPNLVFGVDIWGLGIAVTEFLLGYHLFNIPAPEDHLLKDAMIFHHIDFNQLLQTDESLENSTKLKEIKEITELLKLNPFHRRKVKNN